MSALKRYKVIRCVKCGRISTSSAAKIFKCSYCGVSEKIFKKGEIGIAVNMLKDFDLPQEASRYCAVAKDNYENNGELTKQGFYTTGRGIACQNK